MWYNKCKEESQTPVELGAKRVEGKRKFSLAKRKCGIGLIVTRLKETTCHCFAVSVLLLNLRKIGKVLFTIFYHGFKNC